MPSPDDVRVWEGHVVVCGLQGVGLRTVEQLSQMDARVVVLDDDVAAARARRALKTWGVPYLAVDPRLPGSLAAAGLAGAAALVCADDDDLVTLETALLARELRPDMPVVVQMSNPAVGRAMAEAGVRVLDVAALASPSVVEACLATGAHMVELAGEPFVVARVIADRPGTLRELFGDLAPVAVWRVSPAAGTSQVEVCPGRDLPVSPGDAVTLFGNAEQLRVQGVSTRQVREAAVASRGPGGGARMRGERHGPVEGTVEARVRHLLRSLARATDRRLRLALLALGLLALTATTVLRLFYREPDGTRMTVLDAVYFTVETIGTIGYGDFSFREQPPGLRVFAVGLMVLGATIGTIFFALLTNLLVSRRLEESLGHRRVTGLSGHVIVVGLGSIGVRVVQGLRTAGCDVVVLEHDDSGRYVAQVRAQGVPVVIGDATLTQTLELVNVKAARSVAILTSNDLTNLEIGLTARDLLAGRRDVRLVLRLFDRELARSVRQSFGFNHVRSTSELAAPWFVGAALGLDVLGTFYAAGMPLLLARLVIPSGGGLDGVALGDLAAQSRVLAIRRADAGAVDAGPEGAGVLEHPPRRHTRLTAGDEAFVVGTHEELLRVLRRGRPVAPVGSSADSVGRTEI